MGCLNGKFLTNRSSQTSASVTGRNNGDLYSKNDDSLNSSSPDEDKLLHEHVGNGTGKTKLGQGIRGSKKRGSKSKLLPSSVDRDKMFDQADDDGPPASPIASKSPANGGGGVGFFGRRLGMLANSSKNADRLDGGSPVLGTPQNGSILHSLGTLLENGGRNSSASPKLPSCSQQRHDNVESHFESPLTPDRLHKNFQERLLTSQVSRNNQRLTDSQLEFFRMLDEKIAQGREYEKWGEANFPNS